MTSSTPTPTPTAESAPALEPTASQTVGPFFGYALPFPGGADIAPPGHPDTVTVHGYVFDGAGQPIPDALLEFWQASPDGSLLGAPGSLRRDQVDGRVLGRDHVRFTGFARIPTDADGHYALRTYTPAPIGRSAPYLAVCLFARGLLTHLFTRVYFAEHATAHAADPLLTALAPQRRATLIARPEGERTHRFDLRIQAGPDEAGPPTEPQRSDHGSNTSEAGDGGDETVFLEFRG